MECIHISIGELWDKHTILMIKKEKITDSTKLHCVLYELDVLNKSMEKYDYLCSTLYLDLKCINEQLWNIEDTIRIKELHKEFDTHFIELARSVYIMNDKRAICKQKINIEFGSSIQEVKQYVHY
jgi:hypothetical protein